MSKSKAGKPIHDVYVDLIRAQMKRRSWSISELARQHEARTGTCSRCFVSRILGGYQEPKLGWADELLETLGYEICFRKVPKRT